MKIISKSAGILVAILLFSATQLFAQQKSYTSRDGFYLGLSAGTWFPDGKNKVLGNPLMGGLIMELKSGKAAFSLVFDIIVNVKKTDTLLIKYNNKLILKFKFIDSLKSKLKFLIGKRIRKLLIGNKFFIS